VKRGGVADRLQNGGSHVLVTAITQNQLNEMQPKKHLTFKIESGKIKLL